ncbi:hypothetical protein QC762_100230 [Podospora pseudocomata]|uniref:Fork-head domain-containing protein n=1 Tax=Podospora pseudocomata TaxID=2093779 RepID=A0ABR0GRL5_9PEZI|nr:hypothetical protein QC762_100230 [Podospora pseudocomata]
MTLYAPFRTGDAESSLSNIPTPPELPVMDPELYHNNNNNNNNTPSSSFTVPSSIASVKRDPSISQSPPHMSPLTSVEAMYTASPQLVTRTNSTTPDPAHADGQLVVGMGIRNGECQRAFMPSSVPRQGASSSMWSACMGGSQTGSNDFDNYALHSSRPGQVTDGLTPPSSRSWTPPEHIRSVSWDHYPRQQLVPSYPQGPELTSFPSDGLPYNLPLQSYDGAEGSFLQRSQTEPCPRQYQNEVSTPESLRALSPCSTTLCLKADYDEGLPSPTPAAQQQPLPGTMVDLLGGGGGPHTPPPIGAGNGSQIDSSAPSPTSAAAAVAATVVNPGGGGGASDSGLTGNNTSNSSSNNNKNEEPYAKLIYRAFMSKPNHAMTLQEIYQWFRDNTDKGKDDTKGWQNSIRHNLSMNMAFTKRERKCSIASQSDPSTADDKQPEEETKPVVLSSSSSPATAATSADQKKSTEWYLEPWAIHEGVQSTTRYRKGNQSRRSGALSSSSLRYDDFSRRSSSGSHRGSNKPGVYNGRIRTASSSSLSSASRHAQTNMRNHAQNIAHAMAQAQVAAMAVGYYPPPPPQTSPYAGSHSGFYPAGPLVQVDMPAMGVDQQQQLDYHHQAHQDGYYLHSQRSAASTRAPSDEPVTPEPVNVGLAYGQGTAPDGLLLPDLRTTSASNGDYHGGLMQHHHVYDTHHHNGWGGASTVIMDDGEQHHHMGVVGYHQY